MYTLKDNGILREIECGNNFGYVLEDSGHFVNTDYKVLQSQTSGIFVPCMKMLYNGKIQLYYMTDDYRPMSSMFVGILPDTLITVAANLLADVIEVRNNGFLSSQNIDLSWDKIYVDASTLQVKLVYIPINVKIFDGYAAFENELRASLVKLINKVITASNARLDQFVSDLCNGLLSLDEVYTKSRGAPAPPAGRQSDPGGGQSDKGAGRTGRDGVLRVVAMNAPAHFEFLLDKEELVIGKKAEFVDVVIPYNKMISRKHCRISRRGGSYYITDEGSANGTYVNKVRIDPRQPCQISSGDVIRLADSDFQLV